MKWQNEENENNNNNNNKFLMGYKMGKIMICDSEDSMQRMTTVIYWFFLCSPNGSLSDWLLRSSKVLKFGTCIYIYIYSLVKNSFGGFLWRLHSVRVVRALGRSSSGIKIRSLLFIHSSTNYIPTQYQLHTYQSHTTTL